jgi:hypothetical protein
MNDGCEIRCRSGDRIVRGVTPSEMASSYGRPEFLRGGESEPAGSWPPVRGKSSPVRRNCTEPNSRMRAY